MLRSKLISSSFQVITRYYRPLLKNISWCHNTASSAMRTILNVAEKNDAAKNISAIMSRGNSRRREGMSVYNKIYEFDYNFQGQNCNMIMTSVSGHLLNKEFPIHYKSWQGCNPVTLFDAPVVKGCSQDMMPIKNTLEREIRRCDTLIIWTDCDREGENIGFEIIDVCKNIKANIQVYRAKFSQITGAAINQAMARLGPPNKKVSDAVDVRSELDLRIGASFTRFQTLRLQKLFPAKLSQELISYGSCQFPTMGFVIERYKSIQEFIPEQFWKIDVGHIQEEISVSFHWEEGHLFDQLAVQVIFDKCEENPIATVEKVESKPKLKWRPLPLDTVELEKLASRKLRITAAEAMKVAETLYSNGFISYPRTETNIYPKDIALAPLVEMQTGDPNWGEFAGRVLQDGPNPRQGKKSDQAHPPIHPIKYTHNLQGNQQRLYELIVRHFLACCSKDAKGQETKVKIDIAGEKFNASGLMILERNYLDVYIYERWTGSEIPVYEVGQQFEPSKLEIKEGETSPPNLLTEADLIALMEKHGIGTDATHAEHIETTKKRKYVGLHDQQYFVPCQLGMGLAEGYDNMGFNLSKPYLRAELEADLKRICEGQKNPQVVLTEQIDRYREVFVRSVAQADKIDTAIEQYLQEQRQANVNVALPADIVMVKVRPCPSCGQDMVLKQKRTGDGYFVSCSAFPGCRTAHWFPGGIRQVDVTNETCRQCGPQTKKLKFKFQRGVFDIFYPELEHTACIAGCDQQFLTDIGISTSLPRAGGVNQRPDDSGYDSMGTQTQSQTGRGGTATQPRGGRAGTGTMPRGGGTVLQPRGGGTALQPRGRGRGTAVQPRGGGGGTAVQPMGGGTGTVPRGGGGGTGSWRGRNDGNASWPNFDMGNRGGGTGTNLNNDNNQRNKRPHPPDNPDDGEEIYCQCSEPAAMRTVRKESVNKGRQFYACNKGQGQGCSFFQWADEGAGEAAAAPTQQRGGGGYQQRNNNYNPAPARGGNYRARGQGGGRGRPAGGGPRKCGQCGGEGHNRRNCPNEQ